VDGKNKTEATTNWSRRTRKEEQHIEKKGQRDRSRKTGVGGVEKKGLGRKQPKWKEERVKKTGLQKEGRVTGRGGWVNQISEHLGPQRERIYDKNKDFRLMTLIQIEITVGGGRKSNWTWNKRRRRSELPRGAEKKFHKNDNNSRKMLDKNVFLRRKHRREMSPSKRGFRQRRKRERKNDRRKK